MKTISKKMRLQLYDPEFNQLEDRLVAQETELYKGPKEAHQGPMRIEVCLFDQEDVGGFVAYLQKLSGNLPLETKIKTVKRSGDTTTGIHDEILDKVRAAKEVSQDELLKVLRKLDFICVSGEDLNAASGLGVDPTYQWMIRLIREAKNPINNKYDTTIAYGFKLLGPKENTILVREFDKVESLELPWVSKDKPFNFKKLHLTKFHPAMVEEERLKFSQELGKYRKLLGDEQQLPDKPTKLFLRWMPFTDFLEKEDFQKLWEVSA